MVAVFACVCVPEDLITIRLRGCVPNCWHLVVSLFCTFFTSLSRRRRRRRRMFIFYLFLRFSLVKSLGTQKMGGNLHTFRRVFKMIFVVRKMLVMISIVQSAWFCNARS